MINQKITRNLKDMNQSDKSALELIFETLVDADVDLDSVALEDVKNLLVEISRSKRDRVSACDMVSPTTRQVMTACC